MLLTSLLDGRRVRGSVGHLGVVDHDGRRRRPDDEAGQEVHRRSSVVDAVRGQQVEQRRGRGGRGCSGACQAEQLRRHLVRLLRCLQRRVHNGGSRNTGIAANTRGSWGTRGTCGTRWSRYVRLRRRLRGWLLRRRGEREGHGERRASRADRHWWLRGRRSLELAGSCGGARVVRRRPVPVPATGPGGGGRGLVVHVRHDRVDGVVQDVHHAREEAGGERPARSARERVSVDAGVGHTGSHRVTPARLAHTRHDGSWTSRDGRTTLSRRHTSA